MNLQVPPCHILRYPLTSFPLGSDTFLGIFFHTRANYVLALK